MALSEDQLLMINPQRGTFDNEAKPATLNILCGKIASGKSALAKDIAKDEGGILMSEEC